MWEEKSNAPRLIISHMVAVLALTSYVDKIGFRVEGPYIKDVGIFLAVFYTPLPHVGILTLIYLTSTF